MVYSCAITEQAPGNIPWHNWSLMKHSILHYIKCQLKKVLALLVLVSPQEIVGGSNPYAWAPERSFFEVCLAKDRQKCSSLFYSVHLNSSETLVTNLLLFTTKLEIHASLIFFFFLIQKQYSIGSNSYALTFHSYEQLINLPLICGSLYLC